MVASVEYSLGKILCCSLGTFFIVRLCSKRNEQTLEPEVDYQFGTIGEKNTVIVADPMLATGGTIVDSIKRLVDKYHVAPSDIVINAIVAAPAGVTKIHRNFPETKIIIGSLDSELDQNGYIVPGLGDFGDKYFFGMDDHDLEDFIDRFSLPPEGRKQALLRFNKHILA